MNPRDTWARRRWAVAAIGTVAVGLGFLNLVRVPEPAPMTVATSSAGNSRVGLTPVFQGEAALLDKTPLFLPTEWNSARKEVVLPESGGVFADYAPMFAFAESELKSLQSRVLSAVTTTDALALAAPGPAYLGFGRAEPGPENLGARGAFVEVKEAASGKVVLAETIREAKPSNAIFWQPAEYMVMLDAGGFCGPPIITARTGAEDVDSYFQKYLAQNLRLGTRLGPGSYRIWIGP
jgi:hypothetical protein